MRLQLKAPKKAAILTAIILLVLSTLTVLAQSGRRVKKSDPLPPVPTPEASPTPTPRKTPERPAIPIFLGANTFDSYGNIPFYFGESATKSCAQGLQQDGAVRVELSSHDMTRSDAVKRAKDAKEGYVVLLELRYDRMRGSSSDTQLSRVYIEYVVFAAVTGRPITSGSVYQQTGNSRDIIVGGRSDSTTVAEQRLKIAARVAAERILASIAGREP